MREEENRSKKMEGDEKEGKGDEPKGNQGEEERKERKKNEVWRKQQQDNKLSILTPHRTSTAQQLNKQMKSVQKLMCDLD